MSFGLDNFHSRFVYRVLRPDEDQNENLTCKDANSRRSLALHVEKGLWTPSKYISTAGSLEKAKKWLETANEQTSQIYGNTRTTIVRIDVAMIKSYYPEIANSAIDLTREINRNCFLENDLQKNYARAYKEVVFVKYIPSEVVTFECKKYQFRDENHQLPIQSDDFFRNTNRSDDLSDESIDSVHFEAQNAEPYTPPMDTLSCDYSYIVPTTIIQSTQPLTDNTVDVSAPSNLSCFIEYGTDEIFDENNQLPIQSDDFFRNTNRSDDLSHDTIDSVHSEAQNAEPYTPPLDTLSCDYSYIVPTTPIQSTQPPTDDTVDVSAASNLSCFIEYGTDEILEENHQLPIESNDSFRNTNRSDDLSDQSIDSVHFEAQNAEPYTPPMDLPSFDSSSTVPTTPMPTQPPTANAADVPVLPDLKWGIGLAAVAIGILGIVKFCKS